MRSVAFFCLIVCLSNISALAGDCGTACDRTLSPYFFIRSGDPEVDRFPLESTSAEVRIAAVFAQVTVRQVYRNEGKRTLEAVYVFPASTRAAVHGMKMRIGEQTIFAEIREREQARREYEAARDRGQNAALLEQNRPNVFQMNVANIQPGDRIEVELDYSELLVPEAGVYEFVYPTVVGPRYSTVPRGAAQARDEWVSNPYLRQYKKPPYRFELSAEVLAGLDIQGLECPSHNVQVRFRGPAEANLRLDASEIHGGNRDFVLRYRLAGDRIAAGLLLEEGADENFFLLTLQPPRRVSAEAIPPREYIFIVDVSGSMTGFPLQTSKELLHGLIGDLRPTDFFNVLFFSGGSFLLSESSLPATASNIQWAQETVAAQSSRGGTNLLPALRRALTLPRAAATVSRSILIATDGYVDVERKAFQLIRDHLNDANVFTFGIGSSVNRYLIEGMARAGWGQSFVVSDPGRAQTEAERFRKYVSAPVLTDVRPTFVGFDAYDLEPPRIPDLFAERPLILLGKLRTGSGEISMEALSAQGVWSRNVSVKGARRVPAGLLSRLWARHRLTLLSDYGNLRDEATRRLVTELGLRHHLLTEFTSFVAVDETIRARGEGATRVVQPLPLPRGVSDAAVGGAPRRRFVIARLDPDRFTAPTEVPKDIPILSTLSGATGGVSGGVVGGVPGGVVGGITGGVGVAPPPLAEPATEPIRVGGSVQSSKLVHRVEPVYPEKARRAGVQGMVLLQLTIDAEGNVKDAKLVRGHPLLNAAAIEAVKKWKYSPTFLNGQPVPVIAFVSVNFHL